LVLSTGITGLLRGLVTLQGNQEPLVATPGAH